MPIDNSRDKDDIMKMMQDFPPAANHQVLLANWREPDIARWSFNHLRQLLPTPSVGWWRLPSSTANYCAITISTAPTDYIGN